VVREERTGHFMISTHRDFPTLSYLCAPIIPPTPVYKERPCVYGWLSWMPWIIVY
jgi:hypothetical protein